MPFMKIAHGWDKDDFVAFRPYGFRKGLYVFYGVNNLHGYKINVKKKPLRRKTRGSCFHISTSPKALRLSPQRGSKRQEMHIKTVHPCQYFFDNKRHYLTFQTLWERVFLPVSVRQSLLHEGR